MLTEISLANYRGFDSHSLPLRQFTIAVGQNNAGKSTLVEALRLIAIVTERYRSLAYRQPPAWADLPMRDIGVSPSLEGAEINFATLYHRYGDPPAKVNATFSGGESLAISLGGNQSIHAVIRDAGGDVIRTKTHAAQIRLPLVAAMPQVSPVLSDESLLTEDYVRRSLGSPLASRHFRNQLRVFDQFFAEFRSIAEENWRQLQIRSLDLEQGSASSRLSLQIRNQDFVGELGLMGHGLQMWLQVIWFLTRSRQAHSVILDEPDVYMHPDLQRRLVRFLRARFQQIVITTHSIEIMSEVDADQILVVDRSRPRSGFAGTMDAVQAVLSGIGSAHNIHLARLWASRRLLLLEGKDLRVLEQVHRLLFPDADSLQVIPTVPIGGWSGWNYAIGSSMAFKNAMGQQITTYCVLDSDFHTPDEISERMAEAATRGLELHIWSRKEIESYLLVPVAIARVIASRATKGSVPSEVVVKEKAVAFADARADEIQDNVATEFFHRDRRSGMQAANRRARAWLKARRDRDGHLIGTANAKDLFSDLSGWAQAEFGASFGSTSVLRELRSDEVPEELGKVVSAIERNWSFRGGAA